MLDIINTYLYLFIILLCVQKPHRLPLLHRSAHQWRQVGAEIVAPPHLV